MRQTCKGADDKPEASVIGKIIPHPVDENNNSVTKSDESHQMDKHPHKPGENSFAMSIILTMLLAERIEWLVKK